MLVELERHCKILLKIFSKPDLLVLISSLLRPAMLKPIALFRGFIAVFSLVKHGCAALLTAAQRTSITRLIEKRSKYLRDLRFNQELDFWRGVFAAPQKSGSVSYYKPLMLLVQTFWMWKSSSEDSGG